MDVSIAVPSPRVHSDATAATPSAATTTSTSFSLPSPTPSSMDTGQTTLVHARLDARDVMAAAASDSGQEDEELDSHSSSSPTTPNPMPTTATGVDGAAEVDEEDDVERFDGKIVYNPDGSAYIIEENSQGGGSDLDDCPVRLPKLEGAIVDGRRCATDLHDVPSLPQIASALYVSRGQASHLYHNNMYSNNKATATSASLSNRVNETAAQPVMHSFRVYSARRNSEAKTAIPPLPADCNHSVPIKPILMCFVCKLSFGLAKTLVAHATGEHGVQLDDEEKRILAQANTSAILQLVGKSKEPVISFLEPVASPVTAAQQQHSHSNNSSPADEVDDVKTTEENHDESFETKETAVSFNRPESSSPPSNNNNNGRASVSSPSAASSSATPSPQSPHQQSAGVNLSIAAAAAAAAAGFGNPFLSQQQLQQHQLQQVAAYQQQQAELLSPTGLSTSAAAAMALATRNSCKTLKCPKCNWHYKYQETLEIHMKEKHPESETSCLYCLTGQPHPRLARGETYTCGYKPYRCEVCNYSTTTKGNLSIHMQSDKHLNNAQELHHSSSNGQQGVGGASAGNGGGSSSAHNTSAESLTSPAKTSTSSSSLHQSPSQSSGNPVPSGLASPASVSSLKLASTKPTFRCDVCNYETNVGRNLRIHMTSEKHTHNMIMLQQNVKRMQQLSVLQQHDPSSAGLQTSPGGGGAEAALADMAYQQALFIQMMTGGQLPGQAGLPEQSMGSNPWASGASMGGGGQSPALADPGLNPETMEPLPEPMDPNPSHVFQCLVCSVFCGDVAESVAQHVSADRSRQREHEALLLIGGHYLCRLCAYKTTLKANFQLHCKTDKHLQRLQHATHIQEGGARNDWKLQYVTSTTNPVQLRCNVCEYYTNSVHKLQVHAASPRHQLAVELFRFVSDEAAANAGSRSAVYQCRLCQLDCPNKTALLQHARSLRHCQLEQLAELQRRSSGAANGSKEILGPLELRDLFAVTSSGGGDSDDEGPTGSGPFSISITSPCVLCPPIRSSSSSRCAIRRDAFIKKRKLLLRGQRCQRWDSLSICWTVGKHNPSTFDYLLYYDTIFTFMEVGGWWWCRCSSQGFTTRCKALGRTGAQPHLFF